MPAMRTYILKAVAVVCSIAWPVAAQETADSTGSTGGVEAIGQDTDPTKPVLFSLREEFTSLGENGFVNTVILRADRLVLEGLGVPGPVRGVLTRLDLPIVTFSNSSTSETGLGDIYVQALVAPRIQGNFAMAAGTGLQMPSATSNLLGQGKWIASPTIVPIWFIPREGYAYIKVQDWFSFAGQSNRPGVHYLTVTGLIIRRISKKWWVLFEAESNTDWKNSGSTWYKAGGLVGLMLTNRVGVWVKGDIPFGNDRIGDWSIKASLFVTRF
jgi:hypothetical protein